MSGSLRNFEWFPGYEWKFPNPVDRVCEGQLLGSQRGEIATLICRSPWVADDLERMPGETSVAIAVNHAVLDHPWANYVVGDDEIFFRDCRPADHPDVTFFAGYSQNTAGHLEMWEHPDNVVCYSSPPEVPAGLQLPTRTFPRPRTGHGCMSSVVGMWLAWYMGCQNLYIAGAHFLIDGDKHHGGYQEEPATGFTRAQVTAQYLALLPQQAKQFCASVDAFRRLGFRITWPGEHIARVQAKKVLPKVLPYA